MRVAVAPPVALMDHWLSSVPPLLLAAPPALTPEVVRDPATPALLSKFDLGTFLHVKAL